MNRRIILHIVN